MRADAFIFRPNSTFLRTVIREQRVLLEHGARSARGADGLPSAGPALARPDEAGDDVQQRGLPQRRADDADELAG
jgi:hypothetical protein